MARAALAPFLLLLLAVVCGRAELMPQEIAELNATCRRVRYRTVEQYTLFFDNPKRVFVATGDIDDMWLRDSAVQYAPFLHDPMQKETVELLVKTHAFYIMQDPYANSFKKTLGLAEERPGLRRGGWVATGNWEPDSLAYFLHLLCDVRRPHLLRDPGVRDAINVTLSVFITEQRHEALSPYRYEELPRGGIGAPVAVTGMVWGAHRPSDDAQVYGYNIPVNMFIHSALRKLALHYADERVRPLMRDIARGIHECGIVDGAYAYEVDGLGGRLTEYDDANWPSLLSTPYTGYAKLDRAVYAETRRRLLSPANRYFYKGPAFEGVGSAHTPSGNVWSLAVVARALTSDDPQEVEQQLRYLLAMRCGDGKMHESVNVDSPNRCTRPDFEWANTGLVLLLDQRFPGLCG